MTQTAQRDGDLRYRLLGALAVERGDDATATTLELGPPKQRAVLALLLLNRGRIVSTDRLIDALWSDDPPPSALSSLQAYISNLRRALRITAGDGATIVRRSPGYVIDVDAEHLDVSEFIALAHAAREALEGRRWPEAIAAARDGLRAWRGELLADLRDQAWVEVEIGALEELRTECREALVTALLAESRVSPALQAAQELHLAHPLRDRACWLEVVALHRAGRTPEALDAYQRHARRLDDELGLEPGPELRELQMAILRHDPALAAWPRVADWTGATQVDSPGTARTDADADAGPGDSDPDGAVTTGSGERLVGRERETAALDELVADAVARRPRWAMLTGPAGIGKTRLAQELAARVRAAGGRDVWARCSEEDGAPAWWPVRQLVRALGEDPDALLRAPAGTELDEARFALYERVAALIQRRAADGPLLIAVDDVQWSDRTSARCLAHLVGALRELPVAVVLTLRDGEDDSDLVPLVAALARHEGFRQLGIGPLSAPAVRELAHQVAGDSIGAAESERLAVRTGGNPLFVSEYARLPADDRRSGEIPLAVRAVLDRRLSSLRREVTEPLGVAAVIGDVVEMSTLVAVTGADPDDLADRLDEAADEHIIVPTPDTGSYAFAHGLVREAILAAMGPMRRRRLHIRVAAALHDPSDGDRVMRRASHLVAALPLVDAADALDGCRAAAQVATERFSSETAAEWWAEAVRVFDLQPASARSTDERDALLVEQVAALARSGRGQTIVRVLDAGLVDAMRAGRTATAGRLAASLLRTAGAWPFGALAAEPGPLTHRLDDVRRFVSDDPAALTRVLAANAVGWCYHGDPGVPDGLSTRALALAESIGDSDVLADALLGRLITYSGTAAHARESLVLTERLRGLEHREAPIDRVIARSVTTISLMALGRVADAGAVCAEAAGDADLLKLVVPRLQLRYMEGTLALWRGDVPTAERLHAIAARIHGHSELYYAGSWGLAALSRAFWSDGLADADSELAPGHEAFAWRAAIAAARGEPETARGAASAWLAAQGPEFWTTHGHIALVAHAVADAELIDLAPPLLDLLAPHAGMIATIGHIGHSGPVDLARGRLQALRGDEAQARASVLAGLALAEATGGAPSAARCRAALARLGD